jgi:hypothetical protein
MDKSPNSQIVLPREATLGGPTPRTRRGPQYFRDVGDVQSGRDSARLRRITGTVRLWLTHWLTPDVCALTEPYVSATEFEPYLHLSHCGRLSFSWHRCVPQDPWH